MDAAALLDIYDEALEEAHARGIGAPDDSKEAMTAAAMMLAAMDGIEDEAAYTQVQDIVAANH
ncbi:conserved hypothetical protein [Candidatus Terasakiella magnetica]|uniref:Uncharacterized protein n=1 Tax=Candidatus Terasakiella magnetica TaxID=1867952 RepID=A0A1C3REV9_9PROT|nr:hypothetical protein [Candidatus Terasakiella magnetica]SCA55788.1 conserved hypothetical protein [Candidatus Terasakiella magnetica]